MIHNFKITLLVLVAKLVLTTIAELESFWFQFYARLDRGVQRTTECVLRNPLCPVTVIHCYRFWKYDPEHEAFTDDDWLTRPNRVYDILSKIM